MNPLLISGIASVSALVSGALMLALFGPELPPWLIALTLAAISGLALAVGFGLWHPRLPAWASLPPVRGALCIVVGVGAMFVPANFIVSAFFLGLGTRVVWLAAMELEQAPQEAGRMAPVRELAAGGGIARFRGVTPVTLIEHLPAEPAVSE
jgi:hypothetical protein